MKSSYVSELEPNRVITSSFLVHAKEIRQKKSGEPYLSLMLGDRTGEVDAKMWDNVSDVLDSFERDDFVKVKGLLQVFHNRPQLTIHKMRRMDDSEVDYADYFPSSRRDPQQMWAELCGIVAEMNNPHLKGLLQALLGDEEIAARYRRAPAAKQIHHAYLGGLLEHVLSLCALARMIAQHYSNIDCDLLLAGVVLHDMGKIYELNYDRGFSYSSDGQLLGHISIALRMVGDKLRGLPDFPPLWRSLLLHYIDDMDSKMDCMRFLIEKDRQVEGCFTGYSGALERSALKKDRYLNPEPQARQPRPTVKANGGAPVANAPPVSSPEPESAFAGK